MLKGHRLGRLLTDSGCRIVGGARCFGRVESRRGEASVYVVHLSSLLVPIAVGIRSRRCATPDLAGPMAF